MSLTRRTVLHTGAAALVAPVVNAVDGFGPAPVAQAQAQDRDWKHGLSLFGDLKYPVSFPRFDYVNPNAPKGGIVRMIAFGTFDNFNTVVAGVKGSLAAGMDQTLDTLMVPALDRFPLNTGCLPS